jgi:competence protein ComFC
MPFLKDILNLFFPEICLACKNILSTNENLLCLECRHDLPETKFTNQSNNSVEKMFIGRIPIEHGTSLFFFYKKGKIQEVIHQLKYRNQQEIGALFGEWLGEEIKNSTRFNKIDCIVPVPIHRKKLKKRGYNQLTNFGVSLSKVLNVKFLDHVLIKNETTETQTHKGRIDRWENVKTLFEIQNMNDFKGKHILLIDDVITTGATLEACSNQILQCENVKISIAVIAYTA